MSAYDQQDEQTTPRDPDKLEAGDLVAASPALRWLDNFWYHYKWTFIITVFFIAVGIVCLVQFLTRPKYDTSVAMATHYRMDKAQRSDFEALLNRICPEDFDGNGEKNVNLMFYQVYSDEEIESEVEAYKERGDEFQINTKYNIDEYNNFNSFTMTGETSVYIISPYLYGLLVQGNRLKPLSEVYTDGSLPKGALPDGIGIQLSETDFYKYNPAAQVIPDTAILCFHRPTLAGRGKNAELYGNDMAYFRAIADFEVKE
jgi:hypothetical protein